MISTALHGAVCCHQIAIADQVSNDDCWSVGTLNGKKKCCISLQVVHNPRYKILWQESVYVVR